MCRLADRDFAVLKKLLSVKDELSDAPAADSAAGLDGSARLAVESGSER